MSSAAAHRAALIVALAGLLLAPARADGQRRERARHASEPRGQIGFSLVAADPRGEMGLLVDGGFGGQMHGSYALDRRGAVRLRGDLGFVVYGYERQRYCFSLPFGCRIEADLTTTNNVFFGGLGPEVVLARGPVQPYVNASMGFAWFATTSSLSGADGWDDEGFTTTNFSDGSLAWRAGAGLRVRVRRGSKPVFIDLALEHHDDGVVDYLTEGDIVDEPDGSITMYPTRSEARMVTLRLGVTFGVR